MIERHTITDRAAWLELRKKDVTASVAAALVGEHPRLTAYELWALKTGLLPEDTETNEAMERGVLLEAPVVKVLQQRRPEWRVTQAHQYFRDPSIRLGATPDAYADCPERGRGLIQVKTVESSVFRDQWKQGGVIEPPMWIAIQAIVEAHLTGRKWCAVAVLEVGWGAKLHVLDVPLHAGLIDRIRAETVAFWRAIEEGRAPAPNFAKDADVIRRTWRGIEGDPVDLSGDNELPALLDQREQLSLAKNAAEKRLKEINAEILFKLAGAPCGTCADGRLITAKTVQRKGYTVEASSYVDLRVKAASQPKEKAA
jgi:predicted phage-related endonuclease